MLRWARAPSGLSEATNDKSIHSMRSFSLENQARIFAAASEVAMNKEEKSVGLGEQRL